MDQFPVPQESGGDEEGIKPVDNIPSLGRCCVLSTAMRRFALAAYSSVNIVQAEHHCLQVYSWGSSILSDECPSRYQY